MATWTSGALTRPVLLACVVAAMLGVVCYGRVLKHEKNDSGHVRPHDVTGDLHDDRQRKDARRPTSTERWRLMARQLTTLLRVMKSRQSAQDAHTSPQASRDVTRQRRSSGSADTLSQQREVEREIQQVDDQAGRGHKLAQEQELAREIQEVERDAGRPSEETQLAQEREIAREIQQLQEQSGPAHIRAQQEEIVREIEELETRSGRPDAETRLAQEREIAREIEELERRAGRPSDEDKLAQEQEIAREIEEMETRAKLNSRTNVQMAQEREIASDIKRLLASHPDMAGRLDGGQSDSSSQSQESQETSDVTGDVTGEVDDEPVYDDFFRSDSPAASPLDEDDDDASLLPAIDSSPAVDDTQGHVEVMSPSQGHSQAPPSTWQVTTMTIVMCAIVGVVLLIVAGIWFRDLGYRALLPGKPEQLLLDDDEHTVYNRTTQPEPNQVGQYSPLT